MPFINSQMAGLHFAFPDVCLTPMPVPVPVPYPNLALPMTAIPNQFRVLMLAMPAHNLMTTVPMTNGDNVGVNLNPMSGMVMGPCKHIMGSFRTFIGGMPTTKFLSPTGQNGMSPGAFGLSLIPSQVKVMALS